MPILDLHLRPLNALWTTSLKFHPSQESDEVMILTCLLCVLLSEQHRQRTVLIIRAGCGRNVCCASSSFIFKYIDLRKHAVNSVHTHCSASEVWNTFDYLLHKSIMLFLQATLSCSYTHWSYMSFLFIHVWYNVGRMSTSGRKKHRTWVINLHQRTW